MPFHYPSDGALFTTSKRKTQASACHFSQWSPVTDHSRPLVIRSLLPKTLHFSLIARCPVNRGHRLLCLLIFYYLCMDWTYFIQGHSIFSLKKPNIHLNCFPSYTNKERYHKPASALSTLEYYSRTRTPRTSSPNTFIMSAKVLADKDVNAPMIEQPVNKDVKSMEYHRQVLQSKMAEEET